MKFVDKCKFFLQKLYAPVFQVFARQEFLNYYGYMKAQVYKIHSDFYYVVNEKHDVFTCKLKDVLKKQKADVRVGDYVELSSDNSFISKLLKRKNFLIRPKVANIDLALVMCSVKEPELDLTQLNRYLIYLKNFNIDCAICFNKEDLDDNPKYTEHLIKDIYEKLNYPLFFISAKEGMGLEKLLLFIKDKTIVLVGMSGVGKSTLSNKLNPSVNLRVSEVSKKTLRGSHTTRHVEIIECDNFRIIDTPGFSNLKFDFILPNRLADLFDEFQKYKDKCKYSNCLHNVTEKDICGVYDNLDKIVKSRYESYLIFLSECMEYKEKISKRSIKHEEFKKQTGSTILTKISKHKRLGARNTLKQKIKEDEK